ncbi:unnamed protein product [Prorocentrum cordatum]|uniref:DnaJ homolog subfamily C member 16 n=1 Tax=Prorocentrum cordatum TaxID=2364126 RepID=A0ABN9Y230_9DINO|nr:unnamed protein product [Polarella glacialis]
MPSTLLLALLGALPLRAEGGKKRKGGADYYDILGVKEKDDAATIKKAYRAKSLLYHPDKCEEDKDACQAKFIEVSTAYEVLTDPEKRKVYDRDGEEGLKDGGGGGEQARQMFRQFFGREPDGDVKIVKDRFGRMTFQEMGEPGPKEDIFGDTNVTELTDDVYSSFVNERTEPVIVMFYKDARVGEAKPEYAAFCNTFQSFLMVASVNCRQQRSVCKQASIDSFPAIRWFPEVYDAAFSAKAIGKWVSSMMPDYSKVLEDKHALRQWLDDAKGPAVLLFTDKSSSPPMWKALSREFKGKVSLAVVLRCDKNGVFKTPLQREYDVRVPSIVRLDPLDDVGKIAEKFDHQLKQEVLKIWLLKVLSQGRKAGPVATFKEWSRQRYEESRRTLPVGDVAPHLVALLALIHVQVTEGEDSDMANDGGSATTDIDSFLAVLKKELQEPFDGRFANGVACVGGAPLVQIQPGLDRGSPSEPLWNYSRVQQLRVDKEAPSMRQKDMNELIQIVTDQAAVWVSEELEHDCTNGGGQDAVSIAYNIDYGNPRQQVEATASNIQAKAAAASENPHCTTVLVIGDISYQGAASMNLHAPEIDKGLVLLSRRRERGDMRASALGNPAEVDPEVPARVISQDQRLTQLGRIMVSTLGWIFLQRSTSATLPFLLEQPRGHGVSDHAPAQALFARLCQKAAGDLLLGLRAQAFLRPSPETFVHPGAECEMFNTDREMV